MIFRFLDTLKVHLKVMLAPSNYCFLYQDLCLFVCLQARKKVAQCTFNCFTNLYVCKGNRVNERSAEHNL